MKFRKLTVIFLSGRSIFLAPFLFVQVQPVLAKDVKQPVEPPRLDASAPITPDDCNFLKGPAELFGRSEFWYLSEVNLDLGASLFNKWHNMTADASPTQTGVIESQVATPSEHAKTVSKLITTGAPPASRMCANGSSGDIEPLFCYLPGAQNAGDEEKLYSGLSTDEKISLRTQEYLKRYPSMGVVNLSMGNFRQDIYKKLDDYGPLSGGTVVIGSGNAGTWARRYEPEMTKLKNVVFASSIGSDGIISKFSSPIPGGFVIAAPGENIPSSKGGLTQGTSFAAPLIVAGIDMVKAIVPWLGNKQMQKLLSATALPTLNAFYSSKAHGVGTMNSYLMVQNALQIQKLCANDHTDQCLDRSQKLAASWTARVRDTVPAQLATMKRIFKCGGNSAERSESGSKSYADKCDEALGALRKLRETASILRTDGRLWNALACAYGNMGYRDEDRFYSSLAAANPWPPVSFDAAQARAFNYLKREYPVNFETLASFGTRAIDYFRKEMPSDKSDASNFLLGRILAEDEIGRPAPLSESDYEILRQTAIENPYPMNTRILYMRRNDPMILRHQDELLDAFVKAAKDNPTNIDASIRRTLVDWVENSNPRSPKLMQTFYTYFNNPADAGDNNGEHLFSLMEEKEETIYPLFFDYLAGGGNELVPRFELLRSRGHEEMIENFLHRFLAQERLHPQASFYVPQLVQKLPPERRATLAVWLKDAAIPESAKAILRSALENTH